MVPSSSILAPGSGYSFLFNLSGNPGPITISSITPGFSGLDHWHYARSGSAQTYSDLNAGFWDNHANNISGTGNSSWDYGIACPGCSFGGSRPAGSLLQFVINDISTSSFVPAAVCNRHSGCQDTSFYFAADVIVQATPLFQAFTSSYCGTSPKGLTGLVVGGPLQPQSVPEPATFALMGAGLAGFGFLRRRRKAV